MKDKQVWMTAYIAIKLGSQIFVLNIMASHRVNQKHLAPKTSIFLTTRIKDKLSKCHFIFSQQLYFLYK